jgi:HAD superfamily, subfamily IIIB (Acid phosphatase)
MSKRTCIIFDIDGTISNVDHRRQYVATRPRNWNAWNKNIKNDTPNEAVKFLYHAIQKAHPEVDILIVTGRSDDHRQVTIDWMKKYEFSYKNLYMRKEKDHRDDSIVKSEIADEIEKNYDILFVLEDRKRVVDMWAKRGIWVFDCGQGKGDF